MKNTNISGEAPAPINSSASVQLRPFKYCGRQEGFAGLPDAELWTDLVTGSTHAAETLKANGYEMPNAAELEKGSVIHATKKEDINQLNLNIV